MIAISSKFWESQKGNKVTSITPCLSKVIYLYFHLNIEVHEQND